MSGIGSSRWRPAARSVGLAIAMSLIVGALFSAGQWSQFPISFLISLMYSLAIGLPIALVFRWLRPRVAERSELRQWLTYVGVLVVIIVWGVVAVRVVLVLAGFIDLEQMWDGIIASTEISMVIAVPCTIGAATYSKLHRRLADSEREKQRALTLATDARLASLESRTRPHFLFNALNSAIALIPEDPKRAETILERLCALLRFSLDAHARLVPLGEELEVVADYLEIERVRFGDRLSYELDVPDAVKAIAIPAFAVQTLVENSVKFAVSTRTQGAHIVVRARRAGDRLVISTSDDGPGFTGPIWVRGHGLDSLRARLDALYGQAARLVAPAPDAGGGRPSRSGGSPAGAEVVIELPVEAT